MGEFTVSHAVTDDPFSDHSIRSLETEQQWTLQIVLPDAAARRKYADCVAVIEKLGIGDGVVCGYRSGVDNGTMIGFSLHRNVGDRKISDEKQRLAMVALREIRRLVECEHLVLRGHSEPTLSPRLNDPRPSAGWRYAQEYCNCTGTERLDSARTHSSFVLAFWRQRPR